MNYSNQASFNHADSNSLRLAADASPGAQTAGGSQGGIANQLLAVIGPWRI